MKGDRAEYVINLENAFKFPRTKRLRKAIREIKNFTAKHTRARQVMVSPEVNRFVHSNSKNIPRRVNAVIYREAEKATVFLQGGKEIDAYLKAKADEKKKKDKAGDEKKAGKAAEKKDAAKEEEEKKKLEEKRAKEEAGKAIEIKRG